MGPNSLGWRRLARQRLTAPTLIKGLESRRSPCGAGRHPSFPGTCRGCPATFPLRDRRVAGGRAPRGARLRGRRGDCAQPCLSPVPIGRLQATELPSLSKESQSWKPPWPSKRCGKAPCSIACVVTRASCCRCPRPWLLNRAGKLQNLTANKMHEISFFSSVPHTLPFNFHTYLRDVAERGTGCSCVSPPYFH